MEYATAIQSAARQEASVAAQIALAAADAAKNTTAATLTTALNAMLEETQLLRQSDSQRYDQLRGTIAALGDPIEREDEERPHDAAANSELAALLTEAGTIAQLRQALVAARADCAHYRSELEATKKHSVHVSVVHALEAQNEQTKEELQSVVGLLHDNQNQSGAPLPQHSIVDPSLIAASSIEVDSPKRAPAISSPLANDSAWQEMLVQCTEVGRAKEELTVARSELQECRRKLVDATTDGMQLKGQVERLSKDAHALCYENGILSQQLASLLVTHEKARTRLAQFSLDAASPSRDVAGEFEERTSSSLSQMIALGASFQVPDSSELKGVSARRQTDSNRNPSDELNLDVYSVDSVKDLVTRCQELAKQLWLSSQPGSASAALNVEPRVGLKRARGAEEDGNTQRVQQLVQRRDASSNTTSGDFLLSLADASYMASRAAVDPADFHTAPPLFATEVASSLARAFDSYVETTSALSSAATNPAIATHAEADTIQRLVLLTAEQDRVVEELLQKLWQRDEIIAALQEELDTVTAAMGSEGSPLVALETEIKALGERLRTVVGTEPQHGERTGHSRPSETNDALSSLTTRLQDAAKCLTEQHATISTFFANAGSSTHLSPARRGDNAVLLQTIATLQAELQHKTDALEEERNRAVKTMDRVWQLEVRTQDAQSAAEGVEERIHAMVDPKLLEAAQQQVEALRNDLAETQGRLAEALRFGASKESELIMARDISRQQLQEANARALRLQSTAEAIDRQRQDLDNQLGRLREHQSEEREERSNLQRTVNHQASQIRSLESDLNELKAKLLSAPGTAELFCQIFPSDSASQLAIQRLSIVEAELTRLREKNQRLEQSSQTQSAELLVLRSQAQREHRDLQSRSAAMAAAELRYGAATRDLQEELEAARANSTAQFTEMSRLRAEAAQAAHREEQLREQIRVLGSDPATENVRRYGVSATKDIQQQLAEIHERNSLLTTTVAEHASEIERLREVERSKSALLDSVAQNLHSAQTELDMSHQTAARLQQDVTDLRAQLLLTQSSLTSAEQKVADREKLLITTENNLTRHVEETQRLQSEVQLLTLKTQNLEESIAQQNAAKEELTRRLHQYQLDLEKRTLDNERLVGDNLKLIADAEGLRARVTELHSTTQEQEKALLLKGGPGSQRRNSGGTGGPSGRHFSELVRKR